MADWRIEYMPLYTFECDKCGDRVEQMFKIKNCPEKFVCIYCGGKLRKIIVAGHGGLQLDTSEGCSWLGSARELLQPDDPTEKPIETRSEYKKYLKDHGIVARS